MAYSIQSIRIRYKWHQRRYKSNYTALWRTVYDFTLRTWGTRISMFVMDWYYTFRIMRWWDTYRDFRTNIGMIYLGEIDGRIEWAVNRNRTTLFWEPSYVAFWETVKHFRWIYTQCRAGYFYYFSETYE